MTGRTEVALSFLTGLVIGGAFLTALWLLLNAVWRYWP